MSESPLWQRNRGRDHVICVVHPNALEESRRWMSGAIFILVDFAR